MIDPVHILSRDEHNTLNLSMATAEPKKDTTPTDDQPVPEVVEVYTDTTHAALGVVAHLQERMGWPTDR